MAPFGLSSDHCLANERGDFERRNGVSELEEIAAEVAPQVARREVPLIGIPREGLQYDALELGLHFGVQLRERRDPRGLDLANGIEVRLAEKETPAGEHFPEHDANGENVGAVIDCLAHRRFGR